MKKLTNFILTKIGADGLMHFSLSAIGASLLTLIIPWWVAGIIILITGIGKEIYDKVSKKGCAEWKDLICDLAGIVIGII